MMNVFDLFQPKRAPQAIPTSSRAQGHQVPVQQFQSQTGSTGHSDTSASSVQVGTIKFQSQTASTGHSDPFLPTTNSPMMTTFQSQTGSTGHSDNRLDVE